MIVMYKTDTCISCRRMQPLARDYGVEVVNLSTPENGGYIEKYSLRAVPTFIKFDTEGNEVERHVGALSKQDFTTFIEKD